jgi:hypothetical protein
LDSGSNSLAAFNGGGRVKNVQDCADHIAVIHGNAGGVQ